MWDEATEIAVQTITHLYELRHACNLYGEDFVATELNISKERILLLYTSISHVIYFEIPSCEQISWHMNIHKPSKYPAYAKKWDGKRNSTLGKLETPYSSSTKHCK